MKSNLSHSFDAVVMLTWSNWHTESRKNRYHYSVRFAQSLPVIFVQADLDKEEFQWEKTEVPNVEILHLYNQYNKTQERLLDQALHSKNIERPLFWVYNVHFCHYLKNKKNSFKVYHASEDYFSEDFPSRVKLDDNLMRRMLSTIKYTDLLVSVSKGVEENYLKHTRYRGESIVIKNGCDYRFFAPPQDLSFSPSKPVALYQGNIFGDKLDYDLIDEFIQRMPDWEFWFCGPILFNEPKWRKILDHGSSKYLGNLSVEKLREVSYQATVGIMPFRKWDYIVKRSFPLKAFEFLASGLPVVTIEIESLLPFSDIFLFAHDAPSFEAKLRESIQMRSDKEHLKRRLECAKQQDYDAKFEKVIAKIRELQ